MYVTLVHPAKAVGRNEMLFGRDTHAVPINIVLDRGPSPLTGRFGDWTGDRNPQLKFTLQIVETVTAELLL